MSLFNLNWDEVLSFFLVLVRISVVLALIPFFGDRFIPAQLKILSSFMISLLLFPVLVQSGQVKMAQTKVFFSSTACLLETLFAEILLAAVLAYCARLVFDAVAMGSNFMGQLIGLSMATTYDPHQESQAELLSRLEGAFSFLIFLSIDGHHRILAALFQSYKWIAIGQASLSGAFIQYLVGSTGEVLCLATQFASPILITSFGVNVLFGLLSKAVPQVNIFAISSIVTLFTGMLILYIGFNEFSFWISELLTQSAQWMLDALFALRGGR